MSFFEKIINPIVGSTTGAISGLITGGPAGFFAGGTAGFAKGIQGSIEGEGVGEVAKASTIFGGISGGVARGARGIKAGSWGKVIKGGATKFKAGFGKFAGEVAREGLVGILLNRLSGARLPTEEELAAAAARLEGLQNLGVPNAEEIVVSELEAGASAPSREPLGRFDFRRPQLAAALGGISPVALLIGALMLGLILFLAFSRRSPSAGRRR